MFTHIDVSRRSRRVEKLRRSRRVAIRIAEEPVQAIATPPLTTVAPKVRLRGDQLVGKALGIPLCMTVAQVLLDHVQEHWFTQDH
jgi:hypothetical protein